MRGSVGALARFDPADAPVGDSVGWDAWAEEYALLPERNAAYRFSKSLLYDVLDREVGWRSGLDVLDYNCGCGNDFAYFLRSGHRIAGCDGSPGMLAVAARRFPEAMSDGRVTLYVGPGQAIEPDAFGGRRFDVILSATGGTAYLTETELRRVHAAFSRLLKPGGSMVITHLAPRCLIESLYHAVRLRPRAALRRWRTRLDITVKGEPLVMYLRSERRLRRILGDVTPPDRLVPLNVATPPFQTGFRLPDRLAPTLRRVEHRLQRFPPSLAVCDQVAWITRRPHAQIDEDDPRRGEAAR